MHAQIANLITCSAPLCVQPGVNLHEVAKEEDGTPITFEFCDDCLSRAIWDASNAWQAPTIDSEGESEDPEDEDEEPEDEEDGPDLIDA